jgi:hypothetical protein
MLYSVSFHALNPLESSSTLYQWEVKEVKVIDSAN